MAKEEDVKIRDRGNKIWVDKYHVKGYDVKAHFRKRPHHRK